MLVSYYITDAKNQLIFQYLANSFAPTFVQLVQKLKDSDYDRSSKLIEVSEKAGSSNKFLRASIGRDYEVYKTFSRANKLNYWCLTVKTDDNEELSTPFIVMTEIENELMDHFNKDVLTASKILNNSDRVTMILYWYLNGGEPNAGKRYSNVLKRYVPPKSDLSKVIHSAAHNLQKAIQTSHIDNSMFQQTNILEHEQSNVPWRYQVAKHPNEELYVDMLETVNVTLRPRKSRSGNKSVKVVGGYIKGSVVVRSLLNGNPTVDLKLSTASNDLGIPSFHESVNTNIFLKSPDGKPRFDNVTFLPPDGRTKIMDYLIDLKPSKDSFSHNLGLINVKFDDHIGKNNDEFQIYVTIEKSIAAQIINNLQLDFKFNIDGKRKCHKQNILIPGLEDENNEQNSSQSDNEQENDDLEDYKIRHLRSTCGRFEPTSNPRHCLWIFDQDTPTGFQATFTGCVEYKGKHNSHKLKIANVSASYSYKGQLASGIKVKSIEITSNVKSTSEPAPFKGVKYTTTSTNHQIQAN